MLEALGTELEKAVEQRKAFFERPVTTPEGIELDTELAEAVRNLAEGKSPFGLKGLFGKSEQRRRLDSIRVLGDPPADAANRKYVAEYLALLKRLRELALRWNALVPELQLEAVRGDTPESGLVAAQQYTLYLKVKGLVKAEAEISPLASRVFPNWAHAREVVDDTELLAELERALRHHLTKSRLANVWASTEHFQKALEGRAGRVIEALRQFLSETMGNPDIEGAGRTRHRTDWVRRCPEERTCRAPRSVLSK